MGGWGGGGNITLPPMHEIVDVFTELTYLWMSAEMCESCLYVAQVSLKARAICTSHRLAINVQLFKEEEHGGKNRLYII